MLIDMTVFPVALGSPSVLRQPQRKAELAAFPVSHLTAWFIPKWSFHKAACAPSGVDQLAYCSVLLRILPKQLSFRIVVQFHIIQKSMIAFSPSSAEQL